jgi:hypothetical protein
MPENNSLSTRISGALIPERDRHTSGYLVERERFLNEQVRPTLSATGEFTPEQVESRIAAARASMDSQIQQNAMAGAEQKGDPRTYASQTQQEETASKVSKGLFDGVLGYFGGMFGAIGSFIMEVFIKPIFGDKISNWLSDTFSGKPPEQREKEQTAAGVADGARTKITVEGQEFSLSEGAARGLYTRMLEDKPPQAAIPASSGATAETRPPVDPAIVPTGMRNPGAVPDDNYNQQTAGLTVPPDQGRPTTPAPATLPQPATAR